MSLMQYVAAVFWNLDSLSLAALKTATFPSNKRLYTVYVIEISCGENIMLLDILKLQDKQLRDYLTAYKTIMSMWPHDLALHMSVYPCHYLSASLSLCLCLCMSLSLRMSLSGSLSVSLSVCLYLCLCVCVYLSHSTVGLPVDNDKPLTISHIASFLVYIHVKLRHSILAVSGAS